MHRFLAWPRALRLALLLALCLGAPSLGAALYCDDALFVARLDGAIPSPRPGALWLYTFESGGSTTLTPYWWTSPDLRIAFLRPLSSALFALDHALFGHASLPYHAHTLAWFMASILVVTLIVQKVLSERAGALAALVFAGAPAHAMIALWPSARHVGIAATLGLLALLLHVRARERARPTWIPLLLMAVALASSEVALAVLPYVVTYELFGRDEERRVRLLALAPYAALGVLYLVAYEAMGFGVRASGEYADPMTSPLLYLQSLPRHVGPLAFSQFFGIPSEASVAFPTLVPMMLALGTAAMVAFTLLLRRALRLASAEDRRALSWLLPGALLACLPGMSGIVGDRALFVPGLGLCATIGVTIACAARRDDAGKRPVLSLVGVGWLVLFQLLLAPLSFLAQDASFVGGSRAAASAVKAAPLAKDNRVFGIGIADPLIGMYLQPVLVVNGGPALDTTMLTVSLHDHVVTRTAERTLEIEIVNGSLLENGFETVVRPRSAPMHAGDSVMVGGTRVLIVSEKDGSPTKLSVTFDRELSDPSLAIVIWKDGALRRLPALAIGESVKLPHQKGPAGF